MTTHRERLHQLLDTLPDERLAQAETALAALAMPDDDSIIRADRQALAEAELDPEKIGHALAGYRTRRGWTHEDLAAFLGLSLSQLVSLSVEPRPLVRSKEGIWSHGSGIYALAEAYGADNHRLFEAIEDRPSGA
jgi:hypothetical protein